MLWGACVALFPQHAFALFDRLPIHYPSDWQSVGIIVGVYIGDGLTALDLYRHWSIAMRGLFAKVFGPDGLVRKVWVGREESLRMGVCSGVTLES